MREQIRALLDAQFSDEETAAKAKLQKQIDAFVDKRANAFNKKMDELKATKNFDELRKENKKASAISKLDKIRGLRLEPAREAIKKLPRWIQGEFAIFQKTGKLS